MAAILALTGHSGTDASVSTCALPYAPYDGMLVLPQGQSGQYLIEDCTKRNFGWLNDLISYHLPNPYVTITTKETDAIPNGPAIRAREGTLFRYPANSGGIFIIDELSPGSYQKRLITYTAWTTWFTPCGSYASAIIEVSDANFINSYANGPDVTGTGTRPDGQLLYNGNGIYLLQASQKRMFTSGNAAVSYGFTQPYCYDTSYYPAGASIYAKEGTLFHPSGSTAQYVVDRSGFAYYKRWVNSPDDLIYYGLNQVPLNNWPSSEVNGYPQIADVHPVKTMWNLNWYKNLTTSHLSAHGQYDGGTPPGSWDTAIGLAEGAWNNSAISPRFDNSSSQSADVRIHVDYFTDWPPNQAGCTLLIPLFTSCDSSIPSSGTVSYAMVLIKYFNTPNAATVVHELGHTLLLGHDPGVNTGFDYRCGSQPDGVWGVPVTIMDYDCEWTYGTSGPTNWDICGVNLKHGGTSVGC